METFGVAIEALREAVTVPGPALTLAPLLMNCIGMEEANAVEDALWK